MRAGHTVCKVRKMTKSPGVRRDVYFRSRSPYLVVRMMMQSRDIVEVSPSILCITKVGWAKDGRSLALLWKDGVVLVYRRVALSRYVQTGVRDLASLPLKSGPVENDVVVLENRVVAFDKPPTKPPPTPTDLERCEWKNLITEQMTHLTSRLTERQRAIINSNRA